LIGLQAAANGESQIDQVIMLDNLHLNDRYWPKAAPEIGLIQRH